MKEKFLILKKRKNNYKLNEFNLLILKYYKLYLLIQI
jgi:hypothetical protein